MTDRSQFAALVHAWHLAVAIGELVAALFS